MIVLNIFYYLFYSIAILYEYCIRNINFALGRLTINFYSKYYEQIKSQEQIENIAQKSHHFLNFIYYNNPFILFYFFSIWWDYQQSLGEIFWSIFAFPIACIFFVMIGIRTVKISPYIKFACACGVVSIFTFAGITKALQDTGDFYGIGIFLIPFIVFKILCFLFFKAIATYEVNESIEENAKYQHNEFAKQYAQNSQYTIELFTQKNTFLHFGWFSLPIILIALFWSIDNIFYLAGEHISSWIIFYIIFIIGVRCAGGFLPLLLILFENFKNMGCWYLISYFLGGTTDEIQVDLWLKKVALHSIIASILLLLIVKTF